MAETGAGDREAILAAVRGFVEDPGPRFTTGALRAFREVQDSLDVPLVVDLEHGPVEITLLELLGVSDDTAAVELEASGQMTVPWKGQALSIERRLSGPVTVLRDGEGWAVSDYFFNGRDMRASLRELTIAESSDGIGIRPLAALFVASGQLTIYLAATNGGVEPIRVGRVHVGYQRQPGRWSWQGTNAISRVEAFRPGETRFEVQAWLPESTADDGVRLLIETNEGWLDVRPESAERLARPPLFARTQWWPPYALIVAALAVVVGVFAGVGGAILFLIAAGWCFGRAVRGWTRRVFPRPASTSARMAIALAVTAGALVLSGAASALTRLNFRGTPSFFLNLVLALAAVMFALAFIVRSSRKRSPALIYWASVGQFALLLAIIAGLIVFTFPLPKSVAARQQTQLGRIALDAVLAGHLSQLLNHTYSKDQAYAEVEAKTANELTSQYSLAPAGPPKLGHNTLVYVLEPKLANATGSFQLTVRFVQYGRKEIIWAVEMIGKVSV